MSYREIHQRVLNAADKEELAEAYREWAASYDGDLLDKLDYVAPAQASRILSVHLEELDGLILDAGCGTGLVGLCLKELGYRRVEGLDYSSEMLDQAREKNIYRRLFQADLTGRLALEDARYAAIISVGTFTCGHVGPQAFSELLRITRPGGLICFTVRDRAWDDDGYQEVIEEHAAAGRWQLLEEAMTDYLRGEGSRCRICVYRKSE